MVRFEAEAEARMVPPSSEAPNELLNSISIVIPCYNEHATIRRVVDTVVHSDTGPLRKEIVIVDDFSTDGTRDVLAQMGRESMLAQDSITLKIAFHEKNQGKGAALRTGFQQATGDLVLIQDADLEYHPSDYPALLEPILQGWADAVYGNRFHGSAHRVLYFWHYQANRLLTLLCDMFSDLNLSDMEVGYKLFKRSLLTQMHLRSNRFGFEPEVTIKLAKLRARIYEVPIVYHGRTYAEGKKIGWRDGVAALWHMVRYRFLDDV